MLPSLNCPEHTTESVKFKSVMFLFCFANDVYSGTETDVGVQVRRSCSRNGIYDAGWGQPHWRPQAIRNGRWPLAAPIPNVKSGYDEQHHASQARLWQYRTRRLPTEPATATLWWHATATTATAAGLCPTVCSAKPAHPWAVQPTDDAATTAAAAAVTTASAELLAVGCPGWFDQSETSSAAFDSPTGRLLLLDGWVISLSWEGNFFSSDDFFAGFLFCVKQAWKFHLWEGKATVASMCYFKAVVLRIISNRWWPTNAFPIRMHT